MAVSVKAALAVYVNLEVVLVVVLETDNVVEKLPSFVSEKDFRVWVRT